MYDITSRESFSLMPSLWARVLASRGDVRTPSAQQQQHLCIRTHTHAHVLGDALFALTAAASGPRMFSYLLPLASANFFNLGPGVR